MARRKHRQRKSSAENSEYEIRALDAHIKSIGLATVNEYQAWCRKNGFSRNTNKSRCQRAEEVLFARRNEADIALIHRKQQTRRKSRVVTDIFNGTQNRYALTDPGLMAIHHACERARRNPSTLEALKRLVLVALPCKGMFDSEPATAAAGMVTGNTYADGLLALAEESESWLPDRPPEAWKRRSHNTGRQFASLARHLLARYPVPAFMDAVWFDTRWLSRERRQWFIHLGRGQNIRSAGLPIPYTKKMAHHFVQAPSNYSIESALRWGQIHGLGGDARVAEGLRETRLARDFDNDEFWVTVLRFFVENPMLDTVHYGPVIDYLHNQRFVLQDFYLPGGQLEQQPPPQPNLSMRGREPASLMRHVANWHRDLATVGRRGLRWPSSGINGYRSSEGSDESGNRRVWQIRELLSSDELNTEGRKMHHCVGSYASSCVQRRSSIWTMEVETSAGVSKLLTIEVQLRQRLICQARARYNARPDSKSRNVMSRWATREALNVASYI